MYMYSIGFNPADSPEVLNQWAQRHFVGPGWAFLSGRQSDIETLRKAMGFNSEIPAEDADPVSTIGAIRYGNEPEMRWAHCQALAAPRVIAHSVQLDFGVDPADPSPPPVWNCELLSSIKG
jgi:protein SCO1/2